MSPDRLGFGFQRSAPTSLPYAQVAYQALERRLIGLRSFHLRKSPIFFRTMSA